MRGSAPRAALLALVAAAACGPEEPLEQPKPIVQEAVILYPVELWDQRVEGETVLFVYVNAEGTVDTTYVAQSSGQAQFDSAAVTGARRLRFTPARRGDQRVATWARMPVRFSLEGGARAGPVTGGTQ